MQTVTIASVPTHSVRQLSVYCRGQAWRRLALSPRSDIADWSLSGHRDNRRNRAPLPVHCLRIVQGWCQAWLQ